MLTQLKNQQLDALRVARVMHMVLSMSRPTKHAKTGVYWLRKRFPADLVDRVGRSIITKSLETRDPIEAKHKHAELIAELEAQWEGLRASTRQITDREAHFHAKLLGDSWLEIYHDNPSHQWIWHTDLYDGMDAIPVASSRACYGDTRDR